jgi:hypothetical protein
LDGTLVIHNRNDDLGHWSLGWWKWCDDLRTCLRDDCLFRIKLSHQLRMIDANFGLDAY